MGLVQPVSDKLAFSEGHVVGSGQYSVQPVALEPSALHMCIASRVPEIDYNWLIRASCSFCQHHVHVCIQKDYESLLTFEME